MQAQLALLCIPAFVAGAILNAMWRDHQDVGFRRYLREKGYCPACRRDIKGSLFCKHETQHEEGV